MAERKLAAVEAARELDGSLDRRLRSSFEAITMALQFNRRTLKGYGV